MKVYVVLESYCGHPFDVYCIAATRKLAEKEVEKAKKLEEYDKKFFMYFIYDCNLVTKETKK